MELMTVIVHKVEYILWKCSVCGSCSSTQEAATRCEDDKRKLNQWLSKYNAAIRAGDIYGGLEKSDA